MPPVDSPTPEFRNLHLVRHALVEDKLARLRDAATPAAEFRALLRQVAGLLAMAATADLPLRETPVRTPLEATTARRLAAPVTVVPILRAGLALADGVLDLLPEARVGHFGLHRDEAALRPVPYYSKLPADVAEGDVLLVDPMVATGGSAGHALDQLRQRGCRRLRLLCLVAAPPGIARLLEHHPDVPVFAASLDRGLDARGYIVPGLGDAGDRSFGTP
jgi:uracil phosphoribosyltransferase